MASKRNPMNLNLKKGALHRALGIPEGEKIPVRRLESAAHSTDTHMRKMARLALTMRSWH